MRFFRENQVYLLAIVILIGLAIGLHYLFKEVSIPTWLAFLGVIAAPLLAIDKYHKEKNQKGCKKFFLKMHYWVRQS